MAKVDREVVIKQINILLKLFSENLRNSLKKRINNQVGRNVMF